MTFSSITFLFFLILTFAFHWAREGRRWQNGVCVLASFIFYGWWDYRFCSLILISSLLDFVIGAQLSKTDDTRKRRALLMVSLVGNLGMLGFFKYFNFFAESTVAALNSMGFAANPIFINVLLPAGISFYTFQTLSYTIDIYRGKQKPCPDFVAYMAFVSFFPQLVAGPIERSTDLIPQFQKKRSFDPRFAQSGLALALWGLVKKMVIADNLAPIVNHAYGALDHYHGPVLAIATIAASFQIYADFSAYSDIAAGVARLFGIHLMRNFHYPFFSDSLRSLWSRWHISLNTWFRDYIYFPLGGSRGPKWKQARNLFVTFLISGLWHGAAWTYVAWGAFHGVAMSISHRFKDRRPFLPYPLRILSTFTLFAFSFAIFRAQTLRNAGSICYKLCTQSLNMKYLSEVPAFFSIEGNEPLALLLLAIFVVIEWFNREEWVFLRLPKAPATVRWGTYTLLLWSVLILGTKNHENFAYFQF
ncbi:MAG: hypothetical protein S4CHLAM45_07420 [Chlamydiales bacterium]|nr:hypothetical protein [Chlamydiales bacterium]MCH9620241.1 hypothetical protein [Chlamydiales bacterium]MCH9622849.1 hypothetical protein [Chlamydiales bacterium]